MNLEPKSTVELGNLIWFGLSMAAAIGLLAVLFIVIPRAVMKRWGGDGRGR